MANILDKNLDNLQDLKVLSILMFYLQSVCSTSLQHRLIAKADSLIEEEESVSTRTMERIVIFLRNMGSVKPRVKKKYARFIIQKMKTVDLKKFCVLFKLYHSLGYSLFEIPVSVKSRLPKLLEQCNTTEDFTKALSLLPLTSQETRERLENVLLGLTDQIDHSQLLGILRSMAIARCRNPILIHKICSRIMKKLDLYTTLHLCIIINSVVSLSCYDYKLLAKLEQHLTCKLKESSITNDVIMMTQALSLMCPRSVDKAIISKMDAIVMQCNLAQISHMADAVILWLLKNPKTLHYKKLYKKINTHALEQIRNMKNIDVLFEALMNAMKGQWFQYVLVEATLDCCLRLLPQITYRNIASVSIMLMYIQTRCTPILERIAAETTENVEECTPYVLFTILKLFSCLNYEPPNAEKFYKVCIQQYLADLDSVLPHDMVELAHAISLAGRFPEDLVKSIFNVDFLNRLDLELDVTETEKSVIVRKFLMELNRAVCIECPEYQIPWFHDQVSQQLQWRDDINKNLMCRHIWHLLGEALGGIQYTRMSVVTPYYYTVDFEFILDENKKPISYMDLNLLSADVSKPQFGIGGTMQENKPLPPGAQRVAVNVLYPGEYCRNSFHTKGSMATKKRHLEILGYHVIEIPTTEWNSMDLGTNERWLNYLRKKIFTDEL
ncbi:unnamed protein product [Staurois parvus]|uniref:RAP domain-containing protein n=1 Tax=Staurois parvus TaxID=386267 RepID=A0ABN9BBR2_9NEOB|nr:unnamed protein product [Staurois parvus]